MIDLRNEVILKWEDQSYVPRNRGGAPRTFKSWIGEIVAGGEDSALLLMYGPSPGPDGTELWEVDLRTGSIVRQLLAGEYVISAVRSGDSIYGLLGAYRAVAIDSGKTLSEGSPAILEFALESQ